MTTNVYVPTPQCAKAADRLSAVFNCSNILRYAPKCNESERHMLSRLLSTIGLHSECCKDDLCLCLDYLDDVSGCSFSTPGAYVTQIPFVGAPASEPETPTVRKRPARAKVSEVRKVQKSPKSALAPLVEMTFRKNGILDGHISLLYHKLVTDGWIDTRTTEDEFKLLFSGTRNDCHVIWAGKYGKSTLVYLFCQLIAEGLVNLDNGYTLPRVLEAHFVDGKGNALTNLDHGDPYNEQAVPVVKEYIRMLKFNVGRSHSVNAESEDAFTDASGYGDGYDSYDHQNLRYHNRHGKY